MFDELFVEDLIKTLNRFPGRIDLAIAADVLVYIGDLEELMRCRAVHFLLCMLR